MRKAPDERADVGKNAWHDLISLVIASETRSYGMDQDTACHSFTLRKDVVLNGMIIAIET